MNVIKTILLFVCLASRINSVEAAWNPIEQPFSGVKLVDPNLTIEYETTEQCHFFKISLYDGGIIILDVCKNNITPMQHINDPNSFSKKVMSAFEKINSYQVGKELLNELKAKTSHNNQLVIMPRNIIGDGIGFVYSKYVALEKQQKNDEANVIKKKIPVAVLELLSTFPAAQQPDCTWLDNFLVNTEYGEGSFFSNKCLDKSCHGLPYDTVMLNFELKEPKLFGFSKKFDLSGQENRLIPADVNIEITRDLEHEDDITLFHELNHAKHWIYRIGTYNTDGSTKDKSHSSLGVQITGIDEHASTMVNSEEELQLTGFTQLKDGKIISDHVNEIAYRFNSGRHIRFPYNMKPKAQSCYISLEHLKLLLKFSLGKIGDVFFVD